METININVAKDFSTSPGPRYIKEGNWSGEYFRKSFLSPKIKDAIRTKSKLIIDLDGTAGYGTSFLEEAFGGLIRNENLELNTILQHIVIISTEEDYLIEDINYYLHDAKNSNK